MKLLTTLAWSVVLVGCSSKREAVEASGTFQTAVVSVGGDTTVGSGSPSTRNPTCPDGSLPDQCGSWDGVELMASLNVGEERCLCRPIAFQVPATMPVTSGNAGKHKATLSFRKESGATVECKYKGDRVGGRSGGTSGGWQYVFEKCSDNSVAGATLRADWFSLSVSATDTQAGPGEVKLRLGEPDVVDGVVQEMIFYSSDPRIGEAALHVPRGAAPSFQDFTLSVLDQVPVGASFENGGDPGNGLGYAVDVHAAGVEDFVFTPVSGASCPRVELPYDPEVLLDLGISDEQLQARQILDLNALLAGQSALAPVGGVTVDPLRHTVTFCVEHLSFYFTYSPSWFSNLISAIWSGTGTDLLNASTMPTVVPNQHYTLALTFENAASQIWTQHTEPDPWMTSDVVLLAVERTDDHTGTPKVQPVASPWFEGQTYRNDVFEVLPNNQVRFIVELDAPETTTTYPGDLFLNLCLARRDLTDLDPDSDYLSFGACFSWDIGQDDTNHGYTAASIVEICDGKDNDGVGGPDNSIGSAGTSCPASAPGGGECPGQWQCTGTPGSGPNGLSCTQAPTTEVCDSIDNDCNGLKDEVLGASCQSCGGFTRCDGSCTVNDPADLGDGCGSCGGTIQCDSSCSVNDPADLGQVCLSDRAGLEGAIGACACGTRQCSGACVEDTPPGDFSTSQFQCGDVSEAWDWNCDGWVEADPSIPFTDEDLCAGINTPCPSTITYLPCNGTLCPVNFAREGFVPCGAQLWEQHCSSFSVGSGIGADNVICFQDSVTPSSSLLACR